MKTFTLSGLPRAVSAAVLMFGLAARAAEAPAAPAKSFALVAPKSVFAYDASAGKDPFYPNSTRRQEVAATSAATTNVVVQPVAYYLDKIALKGISGVKGQMLAILNSSTVGVGELAEIKCGPQVVKVRCREIRDRSVVIELEGGGEVREIKLREGI